MRTDEQRAKDREVCWEGSQESMAETSRILKLLVEEPPLSGASARSVEYSALMAALAGVAAVGRGTYLELQEINDLLRAQRDRLEVPV